MTVASRLLTDCCAFLELAIDVSKIAAVLGRQFAQADVLEAEMHDVRPQQVASTHEFARKPSERLFKTGQRLFRATGCDAVTLLRMREC